MDALEQATRDELIEELAKRVPALLVVGLKEVKGNSDQERPFLEYRGGLWTAIGLAKYAEQDMIEQALDAEEVEQDDE